MNSFSSKGRPPTIEDVARMARVSTATVSRSLNTPDRVREATRLEVEKAVLELGYTPNFGGQALASNRTNTIGAIIPTMDNAIFATALQALQETLAAKGLTLLVATSRYSPDEEEGQIRNLLARGVDGVVLIGTGRTPSAYKLLETRGVPFAVLWSIPADPERLMIGFDNAGAAADVAVRVIEKGHRRIAMISGLMQNNDRATARVAGVTAALRQADLGMRPSWLIECRYSLNHGERAARRLLQSSSRPTAIICGNDVLAAGALMAAHELNIAVPEELSITGFDDIELARAVFPQLTTVRVPHRRMGATAGECLLRWINEGTRPRSMTLPTQFLDRQSLGHMRP